MKKLIFATFFLSLLWTACEKTPMSEDIMTLTDSRDGLVYEIKTFGSQTWMVENLRYNAFGSALDPNNPSITYGRLYDWSTVMNGETSSNSSPSGVQGICPSGWHLPSDAEWSTLETTLGMNSSDATNAGYRGTHGIDMKSTTGWVSNGNGTNLSGFNVLPTGGYYRIFGGLGGSAFFWSSTESSTTNSLYRKLHCREEGVFRHNHSKTYGISCRCVQN